MVQDQNFCFLAGNAQSIIGSLRMRWHASNTKIKSKTVQHDCRRAGKCEMMANMSNIGQYSRNEMLALLKWQRDMGVDVGVVDDPINRFLRPAGKDGALNENRDGGNGRPDGIPASANPAAQAENMPPPGSTAAPLAGLHQDKSEAAELAAKANNLDELRQALEVYDGCSLKRQASQLVFGDGNRQAKIMLVGEAPGRDEDLQGRPFVGRSGQLLDHMLSAIGLDRSGVYIANIVPWRPPGNRTPSPLEVALCLPFLHRQIELVAPKILVTLGGSATQTMFDARLAITKVRGQWREIELGQHQMRAMATLHPAFLLRQPAQKRLAWLDMLAIATAMKEMGIQTSIKRPDSQ